MVALSEQPLTQAEKNAIIWHADQQVHAARKAGIVTDPHQEKTLWEQAAGDLLDDPDLLKQIVKAHRRCLHGKAVNSAEVVLAYDQENEPLPASAASLPARRSHGTLHAAAATLCMAAPITGAMVPYVPHEPEVPVCEWERRMRVARDKKKEPRHER